MNGKLVIAGAVGGLITALMYDLDQWSNSTPEGEKPETFLWRKAVKRWAAGAVTGATLAMGWDVTVDF